MLSAKMDTLNAQVDSAVSVIDYYRSLAADGQITVDQAKQRSLDYLRKYRYGGGGYIGIVTSNAIMMLAPGKPELEQKDATNLVDPKGRHLIVNIVNSDRDGSHVSYYSWPKLGQSEPVEKITVSKWIRDWDWHVNTGAYTDDIHAEFLTHLLRSLVLVTAIGIAFTSAMILVIRQVLKNLGGDPEYAKRVCYEIAEGNLAISILTKDQDSTSLLFALKTMQGRLTETVGQIKLIADSITSAASEIAGGNQDLSQRTEEQAAALEETASSMEQLTGIVKNTAESATQASEMAAHSADVARRGRSAMQSVIETMADISSTSTKISDILSAIESIAFQTNILALNAAVESARAGEHGRGFAVVASEVRSLAQRSAISAKEIKELIDMSVQGVQRGTGHVEGTGKTMDEILGSISRLNQTMSEIAAASVEQSTGIEQVGKAVQQMDEMTQRNAALVEEAAAASSLLAGRAVELKTSIAMFKLSS
ncbi:methyl-accepting chemotaxis protein [Paraburkholderia caribensis]|uniref:methyl-accepting chemotaxis protein n=1 Tax=Paraburkholderia caribensis TaxID=75105 RepID=UPI001CB2C9C0|nr:methyl-accepting chemotaxis protein [Paraburkholderia caribensis]CAG9263129.1 Methyl-accepting chemotaxis sensory transducer [Paraburkholderia caribensis]